MTDVVAGWSLVVAGVTVLAWWLRCAANEAKREDES